MVPYDDVGLLRPAYVDPGTGYPRYGPDQVDEARPYATLRRLQVPVDAMRAVREHTVAAVLAEHRERLQGRAAISQVTIVADDLPKSIAFYRDACDDANPESHPWRGGRRNSAWVSRASTPRTHVRSPPVLWRSKHRSAGRGSRGRPPCGTPAASTSTYTKGESEPGAEGRREDMLNQ
jgi:hypothetical protein